MELLQVLVAGKIAVDKNVQGIVEVSVDGTDEGLHFGDDTLDDFFGEVCKDGGAVVKGI